jgi:hypothetical protein
MGVTAIVAVSFLCAFCGGLAADPALSSVNGTIVARAKDFVLEQEETGIRIDLALFVNHTLGVIQALQNQVRGWKVPLLVFSFMYRMSPISSCEGFLEERVELIECHSGTREHTHTHTHIYIYIYTHTHSLSLRKGDNDNNLVVRFPFARG